VRRLGVLGGTFDPIHQGHLVIATQALTNFELDRIVFVPAGNPWQRSGFSHPEDRFMMTVLATDPFPRFCVSRVELDRRGPTYTADTMRSLRDFYGDEVEMSFIAGADAAANLHTWKKLDEFAELAHVIAVARPGYPSATMSGPVRVHVLDVGGVDVSGTELRRRVAEGESIDGLVPAEVVAFMAERGLYREGTRQEAG
jgi:nicotinate-nucleotide adenylyltransferase